MPKKIKIEHTEELRQLSIMEGESLEIVLGRKNNHSIFLKMAKKDGVCVLDFYDPDSKENHLFKWEDKH